MTSFNNVDDKSEWDSRKKGPHRDKRYSSKWYRTTFFSTAVITIIIGERAREYELITQSSQPTWVYHDYYILLVFLTLKVPLLLDNKFDDPFPHDANATFTTSKNKWSAALSAEKASSALMCENVIFIFLNVWPFSWTSQHHHHHHHHRIIIIVLVVDVVIIINFGSFVFLVPARPTNEAIQTKH